MGIPFNDLKAQHAALAADVEAAALRVLRSGWYILGPEVAAFEAEFAAWLGLPGPSLAVGVNSGTDALHLALLACGCGPGDEVITVAHTAVATVAAIVACGARPVLVDIKADTYTLDPARLAAALTPATKAIIPVHLYGQAADLAPILAFARQHNLQVIEDCAQAAGARYQNRPVGTWGDLACFSFYPTKNLGAAGDGGMVVSAQESLAGRVRSVREYGWRAGARYISQEHGLNSRLDELQAALLRVKLPHVQAWNERRQALAARYDRLLVGSGILTPHRRPGASHVYHLYVIRHPRRDELQEALKASGVGALIHYPAPVHLQPAYRRLAAPGALPVTEQVAQEILSLPLYPEMTDAQVDEAAAAVRRAAASL
ncbi:DegT/DnrJ/EryC1/StrS family aminotransferase [Candidatus Amarolinea aalborgensis]|uniref:DegT/DnrJ/EryC1/StrS family aminotransferase n=1 Tax=Candidatus Amarolinea aalborgensis TaxID=2249329 RepID=UPI003BFA30D7